MKIAKITILGEERLLCFSTRVMCDATERFGGVGEMFGVMREDDLKRKMDGIFWLLAALLKAGKAYAQLVGEPCPEPLSAEQLMDLYGVDDLGGLTAAVAEAVTAGARRTVEAEPGKNSEATPEK